MQNEEQVRQMALDDCHTAVELIREKGGAAEATEFAKWLVSVAHKVAEAGKEGGFLGFGGTAVNDQEKAALQSLSQSLGMNA